VEKFSTIVSKAVAMLMPDIDTDVISPLESLTTDKTVADVAFSALRYIDGNTDRREPNPSFFLNQPKYHGAKIMLTGENFGCGSSREMAAISLKDLGFRCLLGSSFGDIFFDNCFKQGILLISFPVTTIERFANQIHKGNFEIDLNLNQITTPDGEITEFETDSWRRESLLLGLDSIDLSLTRSDKIKEFQRIDRLQRPWVYQTPASM